MFVWDAVKYVIRLCWIYLGDCGTTQASDRKLEINPTLVGEREIKPYFLKTVISPEVEY